ncbi:MAG: hypothetical protein AAFW81_01780 [Pseudomonadota bacterium]
MRKIYLFSLACAFLAMIGAASALQSETSPEATTEALAAWDDVYSVFSHPRCANCHVGDDNRPRWSGPSYGLAEGEWRYHGMNINAGASRIGAETLLCNACHGETNSDAPHGPPGAHVWALAPVEMVWWEQSSQEICEQIKDPTRNGGRTLEEVAEHVAEDELVHWGWAPGPGREPAPFSAEIIAERITVWAAAGAPCPVSAQ